MGDDLKDAYKQIAELKQQVAALTKECETLAAGSCDAPYGDDYGNQRCRTIDELRKQLATLTLTWTTEPPTKSGWYWWRDEAHTIVLVCYVEIGSVDSCVSFAYGERYRLLSAMRGQWSDKPIPTPREPEEELCRRR